MKVAIVSSKMLRSHKWRSWRPETYTGNSNEVDSKLAVANETLKKTRTRIKNLKAEKAKLIKEAAALEKEGLVKILKEE